MMNSPFLTSSMDSFRPPSHVWVLNLARRPRILRPVSTPTLLSFFLIASLCMRAFGSLVNGSFAHTWFFVPWMGLDSQTGYRTQFLPLYTGSLAQDPRLPSKESLPMKDAEPIAVTVFNWHADHPCLGKGGSGEYLATWFVGQIAEDAVRGPFLRFPSPFHHDARRSLNGHCECLFFAAWMLIITMYV
jgi:hypothetical protein